MNPNREELLFQLALMKPEEERAEFLDRECGHDKALRQRIDALLAAHEQSKGVLAETKAAEKGTMKIEFADEPPDETIAKCSCSKAATIKVPDFHSCHPPANCWCIGISNKTSACT